MSATRKMWVNRLSRLINSNFGPFMNNLKKIVKILWKIFISPWTFAMYMSKNIASPFDRMWLTDIFGMVISFIAFVFLFIVLDKLVLENVAIPEFVLQSNASDACYVNAVKRNMNTDTAKKYGWKDGDGNPTMSLHVYTKGFCFGMSTEESKYNDQTRSTYGF